MRYSRHGEVIWDRVDGAFVLCHTQTGVFFRTNDVGALIWEACDERTVDELLAVLQSSFPDVDRQALLQDTTEFLNSLQASGLVEVRQ